MKKILSIGLSIVLILTVFICPVNAAKGKAMNWYTTRNKEHKQALVPTPLAQVENYGGVYIDHRFNDQNGEKVVYLTFDVGYENGNVERIVNIWFPFFSLLNFCRHPIPRKAVLLAWGIPQGRGFRL